MTDYRPSPDFDGMVTPGSRGYPRPTLRRAEWTSLDGAWDFALDREARWTLPDQVAWEATIAVPFAPETPASGVGEAGFFRSCWYRRRFDQPDLSGDRRLLIQFGAVDYSATVWVNGLLAARHEGGYTPFQADVTDLLFGTGPQTIVVRAEDDPHDLAKPRGKQDWQVVPHSIWYSRTTGIWQSVWLEVVPSTRIGILRWAPCMTHWDVSLHMVLEGERREGLRLDVRLRSGDRLLADDSYAVLDGESQRRIAMADPGIDDSRNQLLWSPASPNLIQAELRLRDESGATIDEVRSYTALRSLSVQGDRIVLNGRPIPLRLVLDQGYWPETGITAPDDEALRRDVELAKRMGFNGVRKHQKIEDPRYLFWADVLGLMVWEEMPSAYRYTKKSIERVLAEWVEAVDRDMSHPCIVAWVPINESWGVPDLPDSAAQRHYVRALYHLTKSLDPTRPVVGNDGWESVATDIIGIHDYDEDPGRIAARYGAEQSGPRLLAREQPGGRRLVLDGDGLNDRPIVLTEFGGIALADDRDATWGYSSAESSQGLAARYASLLAAVRSSPVLAGFCYTQFADTYQEANGLLYADRTPKFPLDQIAAATRGPLSERERQDEQLWRERLMAGLRGQYHSPAEDYRMQEERH